MATWTDISTDASITEYERWPEEGQYIGLYDDDDNFQLYGVSRTRLTSSDMLKYADCNHIFYELAGGEIRSYSLTNATPATALAAAVVGTRWEVGNIDASLVALTKDFDEKYKNPLEFIRKMETELDCRLSFRVVISDHEITHLYIDMLEVDEVFKGQRFEFGHNLQDININVDAEVLYTALVGLGLGDEVDIATGDPIPLTFESINGGIDWVGDEDARLLYGIPDGSGGMRHRFGVYNSSAETKAGLLAATKTQVARQCRPLVEVEGKIADLESVKITDIVTGLPTTLSHEKIRLNNVCQVIARNKGLLAAVEVKIIRVERHLKDKGQTVVTFGDPLALGSDIIKALEDKLVWQDKRRRQMDRGRGGATVTIASEASSSAPWYANIIVPAGATDFETYFAQAIALLPTSGGQIVILEGAYTYGANLSITKDNVKVSGQGAGTVLTLKSGTNADTEGLYASGGTGIEISDISLNGNKANQSSGTCYGIRLISCTKFSISNVRAINHTRTGIFCTDPSNAEIKNCYSADNDSNGINSQGNISEVSFINNRCTGNSGTGIRAAADVGETITSITIAGNISIGNNQHGIYCRRAYSSAITGNTCKQSGIDAAYAGIYLVLSHNNTVSGNTSNGNGYQGIALTDSHYNTINGNTCNDSGTQSGISLFATGTNSNNNIITNNVCAGNAGRGIYIASNYNTVQANKCYDNAGFGATIATGATGNQVTNNDLYNNTSGPLQDSGTGTVTAAGNR